MKNQFFSLSIHRSYSTAKQFFSTKLQTSIHTLLDKASPITRVRIWRSGYFMDSSSKQVFVPANVVKSLFAPYLKKGIQSSNLVHVSLETKELYASLWPEGITLFNKYKPQQGSANSSNPALDEQSEGRPPDYLVDLHTLDVENIEKKLDEYLKFGSPYHVFGSNRFLKNLRANSCSGLAYDLLISGGIKNLLPTTHFVRDYIITTPNNLAQLVLEAHANEQAMMKPSNQPKP